MPPSFSGRSGGGSFGCSLGRSSTAAAREQLMVAAAVSSHGEPLNLSQKDMDWCASMFRTYLVCRDKNRVRVEHPAEVNSKTILQAAQATDTSDTFCNCVKQIWDEECPVIHEFVEPEKPPCKWYHKWLMGSCPDIDY